MRIALIQINPTVGDLQNNARLIKQFYDRAVEAKADLVVSPELAICGYPPEDLLHKRHFLEDNLATINELARSMTEAAAIIGFAELDGQISNNSAAIIQNGKIIRIHRKGLLPNYGVFDEARYFEPGKKPTVIELAGFRIAVTICRDIWDTDWLRKFLAGQNFDIIVNLSASPFHMGKTHLREQVLSNCTKIFNAPVCYCNMVGGQDELVFDGMSMIADSNGKIAARASAFEQDILIADIMRDEQGNIHIEQRGEKLPNPPGLIEQIYKALILGTRDYTRKNGFEKVLVGLSGGIDSSLVATIATEALGAENVFGITMPSRFNTEQTRSDAALLAERLGIRFMSIPIQDIVDVFDRTLRSVDEWDDKGIAYENLQARIRGCILMSLSNQLGALVLTTGNKSETAVGYCTLYGDTAGGFAVIKDVPKTLVYKLAEYVNRTADREIIPESIIQRPPSAELRPGQKDTDTLPDYELLDKILEGYVEQDKSPRQLIESGLPADAVLKTVQMVDRNEYKRRQSPPGIKITPKAFGKDRRLPITNRYRPSI